MCVDVHASGDGCGSVAVMMMVVPWGDLGGLGGPDGSCGLGGGGCDCGWLSGCGGGGGWLSGSGCGWLSG